MQKVFLKETRDRRTGVRSCLRLLGNSPVQGKQVLIKPNFNTADPAPGSTHNDTLAALVDELWAMGAAGISLGERSYPPTQEVMAEKGVVPLLEQRDVRIINFDDLEASDWVEFKPKDTHWSNGFRIARPILEAECLISTGCLKTHQFGGVFTLSLKLHVGVVPTFRNGYPYMAELHQSPYQRKLIAEINEPFTPDFILMDGIDAFVDGGPAIGKRAEGNLVWSSTDRVAADAVGVAMLKLLGSNRAVMGQKIFEQEQIRRAVQLGLGVSSASDIQLEPADGESRSSAKRLQALLDEG
jgi:uncharacterized protein (DUF362 family)